MTLAEQIYLAYRRTLLQRDLDQNALLNELAKTQAECDRLRLTNEKLKIALRDNERLLRLYQ